MKFTVKLSIFIIIVYFFTYFLLMARNAPAVDKEGKIVFRSSFRLAQSAGRLNSSSIETYEITVLNYFYYPMDKVYYAVFPRNWSLNTIPPS